MGTDAFFKGLNKRLLAFSTRDSCLFQQYYNFFCQNMAYLTVVLFCSLCFERQVPNFVQIRYRLSANSLKHIGHVAIRTTSFVINILCIFEQTMDLYRPGVSNLYWKMTTSVTVGGFASHTCRNTIRVIRNHLTVS